VTGYLALDQKNKNEDQYNALGTTRSELERSEKRMGDYALATDILLGATAVAAGVTIYFAVAGSPSKPSTRMALVPGGAVVTGAF